MEVLHILLNPFGCEIYLKPMEDYVQLDQETDSFTIIESCARKHETFLGYKTYDETGSFSIQMNPFKLDRLVFQKGDKVIVLSDD